MTTCPIFPHCRRDPDLACGGPDECIYHKRLQPPWWLGAGFALALGLVVWALVLWVNA